MDRPLLAVCGHSTSSPSLMIFLAATADDRWMGSMKMLAASEPETVENLDSETMEKLQGETLVREQNRDQKQNLPLWPTWGRGSAGSETGFRGRSSPALTTPPPQHWPSDKRSRRPRWWTPWQLKTLKQTFMVYVCRSVVCSCPVAVKVMTAHLSLC